MQFTTASVICTAFQSPARYPSVTPAVTINDIFATSDTQVVFQLQRIFLIDHLQTIPRNQIKYS